MGRLYPYLVSNVACGMDLRYPLWLYAAICGAVPAHYLLINRMLAGYIGRISPANVLKSRE